MTKTVPLDADAHPSTVLQPSVSVIMTTYNGAAFVADAVGSILGQDHRSLELVVVDDGSTDTTRALLQDLAAADERLRLRPMSHRGIARSRNEALSHARAPLITFLDQDDLCPPGRIARQVARLAAEPEAAALFAQTIMFEDACDVVDLDANRSQLTMLISSALFRREVFADIGQFDAVYEIADDFDFVLRLLESDLRVEVEPEVGVLHRRHPGQRSADSAGARKESTVALARSLRRRRARGLDGSVRHPLQHERSPD